MISHRNYKVNAIVLRRHPLGETDKVLRLFTRERGKISVVAKGARRPSSRFAGGTETLSYARLVIAPGSSLDVVTQCDVGEVFPSLRTDLFRLSCAHYLTELVDRLTEDYHPNKLLFDLLLGGLYLLERGAPGLPLVCAFQFQSSQATGYAPALEDCVHCHSKRPAEKIRGFMVPLGGVICDGCSREVKGWEKITPEEVQVALLLMKKSLPQAVQIQVSPIVFHHLLRLMRHHLEYRIEQPIKSAGFLEGLLSQENFLTPRT